MIHYASTQAAAEYVTVSGAGALRTLSNFAREARHFIGDHPIVLVAAASFTILFFWMTRPKTR